MAEPQALTTWTEVKASLQLPGEVIRVSARAHLRAMSAFKSIACYTCLDTNKTN